MFNRTFRKKGVERPIYLMATEAARYLLDGFLYIKYTDYKYCIKLTLFNFLFVDKILNISSVNFFNKTDITYYKHLKRKKFLQ